MAVCHGSLLHDEDQVRRGIARGRPCHWAPGCHLCVLRPPGWRAFFIERRRPSKRFRGGSLPDRSHSVPKHPVHSGHDTSARAFRTGSVRRYTSWHSRLFATPIRLAGAAPRLFFQTVGSRHDVLYGWTMDGVSKPRILVDREIPLLNDQVFNARYNVSPDGSVAVRLRNSQGTTEIEAVDLDLGATRWTVSTAGSWYAPVWSEDSQEAFGLIRDDKSDSAIFGLLNVIDGSVSMRSPPVGWRPMGFERDGHGLVLTDFDVNRLGAGAHYRSWNAASGAFRDIEPTEAATVEGATEVSPTLGAYLDVDSPKEGGERSAILTDTSNGQQTALPGLPRVQSAAFDNSRRRVLVWADDLPLNTDPRNFDQRGLYIWEPGQPARSVWHGIADGFPEQALSIDDRYLAFQPTYESLELVLLDMITGRSATVPLPHRVVAASVVRVVGGAALIDSPVAENPYPLDPPVVPVGEPIASAPQAIASEIRLEADGSSTFVLSVLRPAANGSVATIARAELPMGSGPNPYGHVFRRSGSLDHLVVMYSEPGYCCVQGQIWRWRPGEQPIPVPVPATFVHVSGPIASPDLRHLAGLSLSGLKLLTLDFDSGRVRVFHLPPSDRGHGPFAWTADRQSILLEGGYYTEGGCDPEPAILAVDLRTGAFSRHRRSELPGLTGHGSQPAARIGGGGDYSTNHRTVTFGGECTGSPRMSLTLPDGFTIIDQEWSQDGRHLLVLASSADGNRILSYGTHGLRLDGKPKILGLSGAALGDLFTLGSPTPDGRWAATSTERLLGSPTSNTGFLDLRSGATYWAPAGLSVDDPDRQRPLRSPRPPPL